MKQLVCLVFLFLTMILKAQWVCMQFSIKDQDGRPVESASITVETAEKRTLPYASKKFKTMIIRTDKNGLASERFMCWDGHVIVSVEASGYYGKTLRDLSFKTNYDMRARETVFLEKEKTINYSDEYIQCSEVVGFKIIDESNPTMFG